MTYSDQERQRKKASDTSDLFVLLQLHPAVLLITCLKILNEGKVLFPMLFNSENHHTFHTLAFSIFLTSAGKGEGMKPKWKKSEWGVERKTEKASERLNAVIKPCCKGSEGCSSKTSQPVLCLTSLCRAVCDHTEGRESYLMSRGMSPPKWDETAIAVCSLIPATLVRTELLSTSESAPNGGFPWDCTT